IRADRRVGARLSRAQDGVDHVAVRGYSPADSRPGCILYIAADVENSLFCRIPRSMSQISWRTTGRASTGGGQPWPAPAVEFWDLIARVDPDAFRDAPQGQIRADPDRRGRPAAAAWDMSTTTAT